LWVERIQYAVGQGGFHGAAIGTGSRTEFPKEPFFTYIYDCGSEQRSPLKTAIDRFSAHHGKVDALFISHLDNDHVNGLDQLLATTDVDTVYLPYVNDLCLVLDLLEIDSQFGLSGTLIEVALDPAGFFGRRGVRRVIRVGPGGTAGSDRSRTAAVRCGGYSTGLARTPEYLLAGAIGPSSWCVALVCHD